MKGKIAFINPNIGWVAIFTTDNSYTVAEVLESYTPELGEIVTGNLNNLGEETLYIESTNEVISVFIQDIYVDRQEAIRQLASV